MFINQDLRGSFFMPVIWVAKRLQKGCKTIIEKNHSMSSFKYKLTVMI
jgi:hypothetical protein